MINLTQIIKDFKIKDCEMYGKNIAKINSVKSKKLGKLILVTAMTSNASGIGKTTISIGLVDALNTLNHKTMLALREPSLGPVFGIKGGATGGGKSTVEPSNEINLHFTGDFHAITTANNLLSAIIDNHIFQGNKLGIKKVFFKRCLDLNDRSLREINYTIRGERYTTGFNITAASELMAIMALSRDLEELKQNISNILIGLDQNDNPIYAHQLNAQDGMTALLVQALKPNLVSTKAGNPALVHLGPFANIAHGCNSVIATDYARKLANYCVTEAGFGSDLGAEKFLDIHCSKLNTKPDACVLVITIPVIKQHGEGDLVAGFKNVERHIHNLTKQFKLPCTVAINVHPTDSKKEIQTIQQLCTNCGVEAIPTYAYTKGAIGCISLAKKVIELTKQENNFTPVYNLSNPIKQKIENIAKNIYGATEVIYTQTANQKIELANKLGFNNFYLNIAKTQFSFTDNKNNLGAPTNFKITITDVEIRSGAKMIVALAGDMLLMPGLGKNSSYNNIKVEDGKIKNLL